MHEGVNILIKFCLCFLFRVKKDLDQNVKIYFCFDFCFFISVV